MEIDYLNKMPNEVVPAFEDEMFVFNVKIYEYKKRISFSLIEISMSYEMAYIEVYETIKHY